MIASNIAEMYQQQAQSMMPPQFLSMPQLMQPSMEMVTETIPVASTPKQQQSKKRSAKSGGNGGGGSNKRAKTNGGKSLTKEHLPLSADDAQPQQQSPKTAVATSAPKKPSKTSSQKKNQQQRQQQRQYATSEPDSGASTMSPQSTTTPPPSQRTDKYSAAVTVNIPCNTEAQSFHDFAQTVHMMKLLTPAERDNVLTSLLQTMTPAEHGLCMGSPRLANKRRVRDVYQVLCYGLNINAERAKHMLTETVEQRGLFHLISNWNPTEKLMLRFREHWYPCTGPMLCEWTAYTADCIERSLNTNTPLKGVGCHICIDAYIQLYQTSHLFNPILNEEEQQQKRLNQSKKAIITAKKLIAAQSAERQQSLEPEAAGQQQQSSEPETAGQQQQSQPPKQRNLVGGDKNIANLQRQHNQTHIDNDFPDDSAGRRRVVDQRIQCRVLFSSRANVQSRARMYTSATRGISEQIEAVGQTRTLIYAVPTAICITREAM